MLSDILRLLLLVGAFAKFHIEASSAEEMKQKYAQVILGCSQENPLTVQDIEQLKKKEMPASRAVHCLFACAYKRTGMMDQQGYLSVGGIHAISQAVYENDPASMQKAIQFTEACKSVNDQPVSDGDAGCDRATFIFKCTIENAPHFDFL